MSSGRKRKAADVSTTLRVIRDLLLELKPLLHGPSLPVARPTDAPAPGSASATTLAHLHTLTNTALELSTVLAAGRETLQPGEQDELDAEGVALWNRGAELRERGLMELYARARAAAYAVIECGCERTLGTEDLIRLLELGAKAASALSSVGDGREAEALLVKAASIEEALSKLPVSNSITEQTQRVRAQTTYFRVRAENMFLRKTMDPALFMMRQACDDIRLSLLAPSDLLPLMTLALNVGHSLLALLAEPKGNSQEVEHAKRAALAIDWLTIGLRLGERSERGATQQSHPASRIVKKNITLALARAFVAAASFDDAYLERAEATLEEIVAIGSPEYEPGDLNRARWLWLQCALQRRSDDLLIRAFNSVIDGDEMTEFNIHRIVKTAIHGKAALSRPATTKVLQHLIQRVASAAAGAEADKQHTELLVNAVLSILVHLKTEQDARVLCRELNIAFDIVSTKVAQLSPSGCKACQMVVWQLGDARFGSTPPQYDEALLFYELSLHAALQPSQADSHLVHRKMALCCILSQKYERAAECIARCDPAEASTCYLKVFNAVQQGLEAPAVAAVRSLAICADVDAKLLLLTTQLATESNLTGVLAAALDALLKKMRSGSVDLSLASALVLARCTIRLDVRHLAKANNDRESDELAAGLIRHFSIALELISSESAKSGGGGRHEKECLWLYKQAYNSAIDGTRQAWPESVVYGLFELALSFVGSFEEIALSTPDEMRTHRALAAYASCVARYVDLAAQSDDDERSRLGNALLRRCEVFFAILEPLVKDESLGSSGAIFLEMSRTVHALQVSCLLNIRAWGAIEDAIKEATELGRVCDEQLFEVFAHLVFSHPACPAEVATNTLDTLLNAALDLDLVPSLERLARWIRASVSLLLASGGPSAATKALEHVNEAIDVMRAHVSPEARSWPQDEADWLIAICATEGQKDSATANEARAKQWLEAAVALLPFASWGDAKAQKLRQRYSAVLARIAAGAKG